MELALRTDLSNFSQSIDFNYHELKEELSTRLTKYQNLVVTADSIKSAKADRAALNKLADAIDAKRRDVKKIILEPYTEFEEKCKDLICLIKEPVTAIDSQIKEFENAEKQKKYAGLQAYFDENIKELSDLVSLDKIINPKWGNATAKVENLKNEIGDTIDRIRENLSTLDNQYRDVPYKSAVISKYCENYDLGKTLVYAAELEKKAKMQQEALRKQSDEPVPAPKVISPTKEDISESNEPLIQGAFKVRASKSKIIALRNYMKSNDIEFKVIKNYTEE